MTGYVRYDLPGGGEVFFEIPGEGLVGPRGGGEEILERGALADQVDGIANAAEQMLDAFRHLALDKVELDFGITIGSSAKWWFVTTSGQGSVNVRLTWSKPTNSD